MPCKQYRLIHKDGLRISQYIARTFDGVAHSSHLRSDNYFYYNCCTGCFLKDCCPSYLTREGFNRLKSGRLESLHIVSSYFKEQLQARMYSKVPILHPRPSPLFHLTLLLGIPGPRRTTCMGSMSMRFANLHSK